MNKVIHKLISRTMSLIILVCFASGSILAQTSVWDGTYTAFTNGTGTQSDPYLIESAQHLAYLAYLVNNGMGTGSNNTIGENLYYKMTTDIDLNGSASFQWTPIGYYDSITDYYCFGGHFDGDGHTIANLYINSSTIQRAGLFGILNGGSIQNVGIIGNSSITLSGSSASGYYAGAIAGYCNGGAIINKVYNTGAVTTSASASSSSSYSGGIIGYDIGSISINNSYNTGAIAAFALSSYCDSYSGGIIGYQVGGTGINNSYNTGAVDASSPSSFSSSYSGGLTGYHHSGNTGINNSYNTGAVTVTHDYISYSGGMIGYRSTGAIIITNSYNVGTAQHAILGSAGIPGITVSNTYYLNTASSNNSNGGDSLTEVFMKSQDFVDLLNAETLAFKMDTANVNNGFPILAGNSCEPPINLRVVEVKGSNVSLSWQGSTDGHFLVEYTKTGGSPQTQTTTANTITLTGLAEQSEYSWQVKNVCNEGESSYVQGANFTTGKGSTGIGNYTDNNYIFIFPNPVQNTLYIQSSPIIEQISIYDISGRMLKQIANPSLEINVSSLTKGIYLVKVKMEEGEVIRKIVKE